MAGLIKISVILLLVGIAAGAANFQFVWTAPELLRTEEPQPEGTQKENVYSYEIVIHETVKEASRPEPEIKKAPKGQLQNPALEGPVSEVCLNCICYASTLCQGMPCDDSTCGLFGITRGFWADSGRFTVNETAYETDEFKSCTKDTHCATRLVQEHMRKFAVDCNGDGRIDCFDYMAIHRMGSNHCSSDLPGYYQHRFNWCVAEAAGA